MRDVEQAGGSNDPPCREKPAAQSCGPEDSDTMVAFHGIEIPQQAVAEFCRHHKIRRLSLFGSILREDFGPDSDVDVLVDFEPGHTVGFRIFEIEEGLSRLVGGRRVDLVNRKYLNPRLRERILAEEEALYAVDGARSPRRRLSQSRPWLGRRRDIPR